VTETVDGDDRVLATTQDRAVYKKKRIVRKKRGGKGDFAQPGIFLRLVRQLRVEDPSLGAKLRTMGSSLAGLKGHE